MRKKSRNVYDQNRRGINPKYSHPSTPHISKSPPIFIRKKMENKRNNQSFTYQTSQFYKGKQRVNRSQNLRPLFEKNKIDSKQVPRSLTGKEIMEKMMREAKIKRMEENEKNRKKLIQIEALRKQAEERVEYRKMLKQRGLRSKSNQLRKRDRYYDRFNDQKGQKKRLAKSSMRVRSRNLKLKPMRKEDALIVEKVENKPGKFKTIRIEAKERGDKKEAVVEQDKVRAAPMVRKEGKEKKRVIDNLKKVRRFSTFKSSSNKNGVSGAQKKSSSQEGQSKKLISLPNTADKPIIRSPKVNTPPSDGQSYMSHKQNPEIWKQSLFMKKKEEANIEVALDKTIDKVGEAKMKEAIDDVQRMIYLGEDINRKKEEKIKFFMSKKKAAKKEDKKDVVVDDDQDGHGFNAPGYLKLYHARKGMKKRGKSGKKIRIKGKKKQRGKGIKDNIEQKEEKDQTDINNIVIKESYRHSTSEKNSKKVAMIQQSLVEFQKLESEARRGVETPTFENLDTFKKTLYKSPDPVKKEDVVDEKNKDEEEGSEAEDGEEEENKGKEETKELIEDKEKESSPKDNNKEDEEQADSPKDKEKNEEITTEIDIEKNISKKMDDSIEDPFGETVKSKSSDEDIQDPFGSTKKSISVDEEIVKDNDSNIKLELDLNDEEPEKKIKEVNETPLNSSGKKTPEIKEEIEEETLLKKDEPIELNVKADKKEVNISKKRPKMAIRRPNRPQIVKQVKEKPKAEKPVKQEDKDLKENKEDTPGIKKPIKESVLFLDEGESDAGKIKGIFLEESNQDF